MANRPFVDTHIHYWDLKDPRLRYLWLERDWVHPVLGNIDGIKGLRYMAPEFIAETRFQNVSKAIHVQAAIGITDPVEETRWLQEQADATGFPHGIVAHCDLASPDAQAVIERHLTELRSLSRRHPRWGYRRAWASLREAGWEANRKKIQRLWRDEGLRVPAKRRKRLRHGVSTSPAARLRACRPDQVWALDFQFDTTSDGRILKLLHVVDEHTREALAIEVARRIDADRTVSVLERIVRTRGFHPSSCAWTTGPS